MYKSWSQQYSFINHGDQTEESIQSKYSDNEKIYKNGFKKNTNDKNVSEKFYKSKTNSDGNKKMLGKSSNKQDWTILTDKNGNQVISNQNYDDFTFESHFKKNLKHASLNNNNNKQNESVSNQLKEYSLSDNQDQILNFFNSKQSFGNLFDIAHLDEFNFDSMFNEDFFNMD